MLTRFLVASSAVLALAFASGCGERNGGADLSFEGTLWDSDARSLHPNAPSKGSRCARWAGAPQPTKKVSAIFSVGSGGCNGGDAISR